MAKNTKQEKMNNEKIKLSLINSNEFINFLKKFSSQEPNILLELRSDKKIVVKTSTPKTRNIIKVGQIDFDEIFMTNEDSIPDNLLIGLYNINNFINTFSLLDEDKIDIILYFEQNKKEQYITKRTTIVTDNLKYNFANAPIESYEYFNDEVIDQIFDADESSADFELDNKLLSKLQKLINNEASKSFTVSSEINDNIYFKGKQFELKVTSPQTINETVSIDIGKHYLNVIDRETYDVYIVSKGLLLKSRDSEFLIAIAREKPAVNTEDMEII